MNCIISHKTAQNCTSCINRNIVPVGREAKRQATAAKRLSLKGSAVARSASPISYSLYLPIQRDLRPHSYGPFFSSASRTFLCSRAFPVYLACIRLFSLGCFAPAPSLKAPRLQSRLPWLSALSSWQMLPYKRRLFDTIE